MDGIVVIVPHETMFESLSTISISVPLVAVGFGGDASLSKLNFYVALVDEMFRRQHRNGTIRIPICASKNDHTVCYSLGPANSPMAVASCPYEILPAEVRKRTPRSRAAHRGTGLSRRTEGA